MGSEVNVRSILHLHRAGTEYEELLDMILPSCLDFCAFLDNLLKEMESCEDLDKHLELDFIVQQLLQLFSCMDFTDQACRNQTEKLFHKMLLSERQQNGFTYVKGVDYAEGAVKLASAVLEKGGFGNVMLQTGDLTCDITVLPESSCLHAKYNVCIDKGTYDAISLMPEEAAKRRMVYRSNVHRLLEPDGFFLITSCNWTKEQLEDFFCTQFKLVDEIKTTLFQFGGKIGRSVTSLIFSPV